MTAQEIMMVALQAVKAAVGRVAQYERIVKPAI